MSQLTDKLAFRVRSLLTNGLVAWPRTLYWRLLGLKTGTTLPSITVNWPHQVSIGQGCTLEPNLQFKFDGVWSPGPSIIIGNGVFLGTGCEFNIRKSIRVGSQCLIASGCRFVDHDHAFADQNLPMAEQGPGIELPIEIQSDVWIGANAVILKGVSIAKGAIIAAGAIVTENVGAYEIWGGVPARKISVRPTSQPPGA
jgi:acetyltransferase-like isoleucine patch superfamily enzyme